MKLSFEFNGISFSGEILILKCDGMWVDVNPNDNLIRVSKDYISRNLESFLYDFIHESWHLRQKEIYEDVLALRKEKSKSPFSNYSNFDRLEEEAEAWALLVTKKVGATKFYRFNSQEKVDWLLNMKSWFNSLGFLTPDASWAQDEFNRFLAETTPPPLPWE